MTGQFAGREGPRRRVAHALGTVRRLTRMAAFHLAQFSRNSYFVQLLLTSTLSIFLIQTLAAKPLGSDSEGIWLRSGMYGCWAVATISSGLIGFQRFQGTLTYLAYGPSGPSLPLGTLVATAATFGLLAFPLSFVASWLAGHDPAVSVGTGAAVLGIVLFWTGSVALSLVLAALFVLTPNAIAYEGAVVIPIVLLSGVFAGPATDTQIGRWVSTAIPQAVPVRLLTEPDATTWRLALLSLGVSLVWISAAARLQRFALHRAEVDASLDLS